MSAQNTTSQILIAVLAVEEQIQKKYEMVKEHQLWNETQQQLIQDTIEELNLFLKETSQRTKDKAIKEPKVKAINKLNNKIDELTTERDRIIDLTEEELEKDERQMQLKLSKKLSSKEPKAKATKEPKKKTKTTIHRPDSMFERVSHIVARYRGKENIGYFHATKVGTAKKHKFFWNKDDQVYHTPNSLHASLREAVDGYLIQRDVWRDCEIMVYFVGEERQSTIGDLSLFHGRIIPTNAYDEDGWNLSY